MFGVTLENGVKPINELGYRIVENSIYRFSTITEIISKQTGDVAAKIRLYGGKGLLQIVVGDNSIENIKWVEIISTHLLCDKKLSLEAQDNLGNRIFCEIPPRSEEPVFKILSKNMV